MSMYERLLEARMEKARELLLHTDLPIKAICSQAGYSRLTVLSRASANVTVTHRDAEEGRELKMES